MRDFWRGRFGPVTATFGYDPCTVWGLNIERDLLHDETAPLWWWHILFVPLPFLGLHLSWSSGAPSRSGKG